MTNLGQRRTDIVVGAVIACAILWTTHYMVAPQYRPFGYVLLMYEAYTLVNRWRGDSISESVWRLAVRPFVPFLFGLATGAAIASGLVVNPWLVLAVGMLMGHFFWQEYRHERRNGRRQRVG